MGVDRRWLLTWALIAGCSSSEARDPGGEVTDMSPGAASDADGVGGQDADGSAGTDHDGQGASDDDGASPGEGAGMDGNGSDTDGGTVGETPSGTGEVPSNLPTASGTCPELTDGTVTFAPAGITARDVTLHVGSGSGGPLVIYWHGTGSSPREAQFGLGNAAIESIKAQGGIVAAPTADPDAGTYPWFLVSGNREDDLVLADEIVACAIAKKNIDVSRIHTLGMSAGGLQSSQMGIRRSSYLASIAVYSGGLGSSFQTPTFADPDNKFAALMFYGGSSDQFIISFEQTTNAYVTLLEDAGHTAIVCDHGGGHTIPGEGGAAAWRFFQDHPFGTNPSPYVSAGLPADFPSYCAL